MPEIYVLTILRDGANVVQRTSPRLKAGFVVADLPSDPDFPVIGSTLVGRTLTAPAPPPAINFTLGRIDRAFEYYIRFVRNPNWPDTAPDFDTGVDGLRGLNKNLYSGAAVCYLLATKTFTDSRGLVVTDDATIERAIAHYEFMCSAYAPVWYRLILKDSARTIRAAWATGSVADGAALFSDLVSAEGLAADRRSLATVRAPLPGNTIPAGFDPEYPGLVRE